MVQPDDIGCVLGVFVIPDRDTLIELLGFKYKYYMSTPAAGGEASDGTAPAVPDDLFKQTSLMIQHGILEMDSIYAMLGPDDKEIEEEAAKEVSLWSALPGIEILSCQSPSLKFRFHYVAL